MVHEVVMIINVIYNEIFYQKYGESTLQNGGEDRIGKSGNI